MRGAHVEHRSTEASPLRRHWRQVNLGPTMGSWPQLSQLNPRCAISLTLLFSADSRCSHSFSRRSLFNHISSMYSSLDLFQEKTINYKITITLKARFYGPRFSGKLDLADKTATTTLRCLVIAETSTLRIFFPSVQFFPHFSSFKTYRRLPSRDTWDRCFCLGYVDLYLPSQ